MLEVGVKNGRPVSVFDVPMGGACGCVCPKCGKPLIAKNLDFKGRMTRMHFAHAEGVTCAATGGETAPETGLHLLAKEILAKELKLMLPAQDIFPGAMRPEFQRAFGPRAVKLRSASLEPWRPAVQAERDMRPDVAVITDKGIEIHVEFRVAHPVPPEKQAAAQREQRWMLEIDLSAFRDWSSNIPDLRRYIQQSIAGRQWLSHGPGYDLKERLVKASSQVEGCPFGIPGALERGLCADCPCRLSPVLEIRPRALRCTGHSRVVSRDALSAWERGEVLPIPAYVRAAQAAARAVMQADEAREARMREIRQRIRELDRNQPHRASLAKLVEEILAASKRTDQLRKRLDGLAVAVRVAAGTRVVQAGEALGAARAALTPALHRLKQAQAAEVLQERAKEFRRATMADYQAGNRPVLCHHCQRRVQGQFRGGALRTIELCECLIPDSERGPDPATWARDRTRRFLAERVRPL